MTDIEVRAEEIDGIVARLQGHVGWQLRHIPSRGYWIEFQPDAKGARAAVEAKA